MNLEKRGKSRDALKAYGEVRKAVDHIESDHFHESPDEDKNRILGAYSSKLPVWRSQIPEELHPRMPYLNMLQMYLSE